MKSKYILLIGVVIITSFASCNRNKNDFDASGAFEAEETIISAEASGTLKEFNITEGQDLKATEFIGFIDSTQLYLKKLQLESQRAALLSRTPNVSVQLASINEQLKSAEYEKIRITKLVKAEAATSKQLDDINAQIDVLKKQLQAQKSNLEISTNGITKDAKAIDIQIEQLNDQLAKCRLTSPMNGTILSKFVEENEMVSPGKAMYKIADLSILNLRVYITADQLALVKLNDKVKVKTDDGKGGFNETDGQITWINSKAEFTPKTIQTKDERANLVYAMKVKVKNNGQFKIGMYAEILFN